LKISDIGGEFELIKRIIGEEVLDKAVVKGVGDDCAVLDTGTDRYQLVTTDMMVENDHFSFEWQTPEQIGIKLMEANVSDIVSMGGTPKYAFISISLTKETTVESVEGIYNGIKESAKEHGVLIVGGDTTHGKEVVLNMTLLGEVDKDILSLRSDARVGDMICVTGNLGGSTAGLRLLLKKMEGYVKDHNEPRSRKVSEGQIIARYANAMIDVSDGLASEVKHICDESSVGAMIDFDKVPLSEETIESAKKLNEDPYDYALYGGEDFELVFTIKKENIPKLKEEFTDFTIVGEILEIKEGLFIMKHGEKCSVGKGFDHFS